jgi:hypothetical protein
MLTNCYEAANLAHVHQNEIGDIEAELVQKKSTLEHSPPFSHFQTTAAAQDSSITHLDASNTGGFSAFDDVHLTHIQLNDTYQEQETSNLTSEINMIKLNEDKQVQTESIAAMDISTQTVDAVKAQQDNIKE